MNPLSRRVVVVLAAIVERGGRLLVTRRIEGTHLAGLWEFPGGKCEPDETHEACLERELREELGARSVVGPEVLVTEHEYPAKVVRLHFRQCVLLDEPRPMIDQQIRWVRRSELPELEFPAADRDLIALLMSAPDAPS